MSQGWTPADQKPPHNVGVRIRLNGIPTSSPAHYDHQLNGWFWSNGFGVGGEVSEWQDFSIGKDEPYLIPPDEPAL